VRLHLLWIPTGAAIIATALQAMQGGFGAGHGSFDRIIWALGLPGVLMDAWAPAPVARHDLLLLVWWPWLWNVLLWAGIAEIATRLRQRAATPDARAQAGAYRHPDGFILHAFHRATSGVLISVPPVLRLPLDVSEAELGAALRELLGACREGVPHPTDWTHSRTAFLEAAGYRSWRSLEAPARACSIEMVEGRLVITPLRNGGSRGDHKGFRPFDAERINANLTGSDEELGQALIMALDRAQ
jgi:hypothetical protein